MRIAVLANLKDNAPTWEGMSSDQWDDLDSPKTIQNIIDGLESGGHEAEFFEASILPPHNLIQRLEEYQPDLCFNIAESHFGDGREAHIPSVLEMLRIPYTGSRVMTLALALDKPMTKRILSYHDLPTPEFQVLSYVDEPLSDEFLDDAGELCFPVFIKPSREGTGMGVTGKSIVRTVADLREQLADMLERYNQPILMERFIKGREVTVGVVGNLRPISARRLNERSVSLSLPEELTYLPPMEIRTAEYGESEAGIYTNRIKVDLVDDFLYDCPADLDLATVDRLNRLTAAVFRVMGCFDVSRVDFRFDESDNNKPYILEINTLPGLNPKYSDICIEAKAYGWSYEHLLNTIVSLAAERYGIQEKTSVQ